VRRMVGKGVTSPRSGRLPFARRADARGAWPGRGCAGRS
jgi:hypothetical protein